MQELLIEAGRTEKNYWSDLWRYRELFYILAWRDICVRYKQTAIGVIWAILRPFLAMIIFTVVFGRIAKMPSNGIPYPILVFAAMLPWQFFANSLSEASSSLVVNTNLISKVYFPRLIIPAGAVITSLVDLLISAALLGVSDDLVSLHAGLATADSSFVHADGLSRSARSRTVPDCSQRQISRFPLRYAIYRAIRTFHFAGRFQQRCYTEQLAPGLFPESNRWSHRWVPLGDLPRRIAASICRALPSRC